MDYKETAARLSQGGIYLPAGIDGSRSHPSSIDEKEAAKAVEQYDHSLMLGQREDTKEWLVFVKRGPEGHPFPVFSFGNRLPHPDDIGKKLYNNDIARHGIKVVTQILRKAEDQKKAEQYAVAEHIGETDELLERATHERSTSRIFVPGGTNGNLQHSKSKHD